MHLLKQNNDKINTCEFYTARQSIRVHITFAPFFAEDSAKCQTLIKYGNKESADRTVNKALKKSNYYALPESIEPLR